MKTAAHHAVRALAVAAVVGSLAVGSASTVNARAARGAEQAAVTRTFSGTGAKRIGTLRLKRSAVLRWKTSGGVFQISVSSRFLLVNTRARSGRVRVYRGVYRGVRVASSGHWKITIRRR
jgi:hypothetical protein